MRQQRLLLRPPLSTPANRSGKAVETEEATFRRWRPPCCAPASSAHDALSVEISTQQQVTGGTYRPVHRDTCSVRESRLCALEGGPEPSTWTYQDRYEARGSLKYGVRSSLPIGTLFT